MICPSDKKFGGGVPSYFTKIDTFTAPNNVTNASQIVDWFTQYSQSNKYILIIKDNFQKRLNELYSLSFINKSLTMNIRYRNSEFTTFNWGASYYDISVNAGETFSVYEYKEAV